jgi:hypothetical protein
MQDIPELPGMFDPFETPIKRLILPCHVCFHRIFLLVGDYHAIGRVGRAAL